MTPINPEKLQGRTELERLTKRLAELRSPRWETTDIQARDAITAEIRKFQGRCHTGQSGFWGDGVDGEGRLLIVKSPLKREAKKRGFSWKSVDIAKAKASREAAPVDENTRVVVGVLQKGTRGVAPLPSRALLCRQIPEALCRLGEKQEI